ncbi:hypothetical protein TWF730_009252 [Orbilia blumenaviensis]|uniref:Uncharacterized protein n=1 Tax=Orbilia blumenaviensis TaxID=1796055 RepID=A0AAV9UYN5_9PEZI
MTEQHIHNFSRIADIAVELMIETSQHLFLVSCANLRQASPVWMVSLDPNTKFAPLPVISIKGREYRKTVIENFSPTTLVYFFNIIHYRPSHIPSNIQFKFLREIALLADEYDCSAALSPWTEIWISHHLKIHKERLQAKEYRVSRMGTLPWVSVDWLFIGKTFANIDGCSDAVRDVSKQMIAQTSVGNLVNCQWASGVNRELKVCWWREQVGQPPEAEVNLPNIYPGVSRYAKSVDTDLIPQPILDFILAERERAMHQILGPFHEFVRGMVDFSLYNSSGIGTKPSLDVDDRCQIPECFSIALGSLMVSLRDKKLEWLLKEKLELPPVSLKDLIYSLWSIRMRTLKTETIERKHSDDWSLLVHLRSKLLRSPSFLNNQQHARIPLGRFPCSLATKLTRLQDAAWAILQQIEGYEIGDGS